MQQSLPQNVLQPQHRFSVNHTGADNAASDLAKSHLVTGGLTKFDDQPESYLSWKTTFQSTIADLGLTSSEEINLLIKWLGPESSEHAKRMKAVNIHHPSAGLGMIWTRLFPTTSSHFLLKTQSFFRRWKESSKMKVTAGLHPYHLGAPGVCSQTTDPMPTSGLSSPHT